MKKIALCAFSFLLILLVFCTIISPKVEEEMRTEVDARHGEAKKNRNLSIGNIAIIWPNSDDTLFNIAEGTGWESGLRIEEIPSTYFDRGVGQVKLGTGTDYWYIYSASREPISGAAVSVIETERGEDTYILWHPETLPPLDTLPNSMDTIIRTDHTALVTNWGATLPFFEHNLWYTLRGSAGDALCIYSLHDVQQFIEALPWITCVATILLCCIILWSVNCYFLHNINVGKGILCTNTLFIAALLSILPLLLNQFDLPASLMPSEYILDFSYYAETFNRIISSMNSLGDPIIQNMLRQTSVTSVLIVVISISIIGFMIAIEKVVFVSVKKSINRNTY